MLQSHTLKKFNFQHYHETEMLQITVFQLNREIKMSQNVASRLNCKIKMPWNSQIVKKFAKLKCCEKIPCPENFFL